MDPRPATGPANPAASPRASGDGPRDTSSGAMSVVVAPRERGWTPLRAVGSPKFARRPARAGMDLRGSQASRNEPASPRASGDGPCYPDKGASCSNVAPRERGWTPDPVLREQLVHRRPARAGMDPSAARRATWACSSPRASGDGPTWFGSPIANVRVAPRKRGWTHGTEVQIDGRSRRPARAGMDPVEIEVRVPQLASPRASGDGPETLAVFQRPLRVAPRERGWTPPFSCGAPWSVRRPARAGMDPRRGRRSCASSASPRASGDGPVTVTRLTLTAGVAPRERGWTRPPPQRRRQLPRRPARAGMDPSSGCTRRPCRSSPRASGDGPGTQQITEKDAVVAPHERGWTPGARADRQPAARRPARAGMNPGAVHAQRRGPGQPVEVPGRRPGNA